MNFILVCRFRRGVKIESTLCAGIWRNLLDCLPMNIMIEDAESLEYLTKDNHWTKNPADGRPFPKIIAAFDVAKKELMGRFNIVGYIPETRQFINLNHGRGRGLPQAVALVG